MIISDEAKRIGEMVFELVGEQDEEFKVWDQILMYLVGDNIVNRSLEERDRKLIEFKEDLDQYVGSFVRL